MAESIHFAFDYTPRIASLAGPAHPSSAERLALFSETVRESTWKRVRQVQAGDEEWRPAPDALSFVDIVKHLVDADVWILQYLAGSSGPRAVIAPGEARARDWPALIAELARLGRDRTQRIARMSEEELAREVDEPQVLGRTNYWWLIVRGSLDHEIHHRGALQLTLRMRYGRGG